MAGTYKHGVSILRTNQKPGIGKGDRTPGRTVCALVPANCRPHQTVSSYSPPWTTSPSTLLKTQRAMVMLSCDTKFFDGFEVDPFLIYLRPAWAGRAIKTAPSRTEFD